ncbi:MAG: hypothetical protein JSV00_08880 [bacterium]|nr:MAG: hypothetical protein JSV00_08880 [bacterium]
MDPDTFRAFLRDTLPPMGYQWRRFERRNIRRKIQRRMESVGIHEADRYAALLAVDPEERRRFQSLLSVTITRFYRNAWLWSVLAGILPAAAREAGGAFHVWCAGCAGGEEPFSVAMLMDDLARRGLAPFPWTVLGTDSDLPSLARAAGTSYNWGSVREVPERILERWFREEEGLWTMDPAIRALVRIEEHDLLREDPPGTFSMVFLRNCVLTYNTEAVQRMVLEKLRGCMQPPGLLVIGRTERLPAGTGFGEVGRCIYRKEEGE